MSEWISVKDKLPQEAALVIIWGGVGSYLGGVWFTHTRCEAKIIQWEVTHWMPLPEPPAIAKGEKE